MVELIEESSESNVNLNKKFWAMPGIFLHDHVQPFLHQIGGQKTLLINSGKALVKSKLVYGSVSAAAIATAVSVPVLNNTPEQTHAPVTEVIAHKPSPAHPVVALQIDSFPAQVPAPEPVVEKKKLRVEKTVVSIVEEPVITKDPESDTIAIVKFRNDFKIQIVADPEEITSDF